MREQVMLAYPLSMKRLTKWTTCYMQPKLNGIRCRALISSNSVILKSSENNEIISVPHIISALQDIFASEPITALELDGELYTHGMSFDTLKSIVLRKNIHADYIQIKYNLFDTISSGNQRVRLHALDYIKTMPEFKQQDFIHVVPTYLIRNMVNISVLMDMFINNGYEGAIFRQPYAHYVRKRSTCLMKWKPRKTDRYKIIGVKEEISIDGIPKNTLGALICIDEDNQTFNVGTGLTAKMRHDLWQNRYHITNGNYIITIKYQNLSDRKKIPIHPVFLTISEDLA